MTRRVDVGYRTQGQLRSAARLFFSFFFFFLSAAVQNWTEEIVGTSCCSCFDVHERSVVSWPYIFVSWMDENDRGALLRTLPFCFQMLIAELAGKNASPDVTTYCCVMSVIDIFELVGGFSACSVWLRCIALGRKWNGFFFLRAIFLRGLVNAYEIYDTINDLYSFLV